MFYCYAKHSDILWRLSQVYCCLMLHVRCWVAVTGNYNYNIIIIRFNINIYRNIDTEN